jgi:hypothetical protein
MAATPPCHTASTKAEQKFTNATSMTSRLYPTFTEKQCFDFIGKYAFVRKRTLRRHFSLYQNVKPTNF